MSWYSFKDTLAAIALWFGVILWAIIAIAAAVTPIALMIVLIVWIVHHL